MHGVCLATVVCCRRASQQWLVSIDFWFSPRKSPETDGAQISGLSFFVSTALMSLGFLPHRMKSISVNEHTGESDKDAAASLKLAAASDRGYVIF